MTYDRKKRKRKHRHYHRLFCFVKTHTHMIMSSVTVLRKCRIKKIKYRNVLSVCVCIVCEEIIACIERKYETNMHTTTTTIENSIIRHKEEKK
jgi:hypothetical protein